MTMTGFQLKLSGPTSTSIHKEVAIRFGGSDGMLIEFHNDKGQAREVMGFDGSWISRYGLAEDERFVL